MTARPRAIVFDWDNTLVDTWDVIHEALNRTLVAFGHAPWTADEVRARVRRSMRESFPPLFGDQWRRAGEHFLAAFAEVHLERIRPTAGAERLLRTMNDLGIVAAVVSNKTGPLLRDEARHLGWDGLFAGAVVGAQDAPRDKPAADPVHIALAPAGLAPGGDVWFAGDTDVDLECAANAGCLGVLVREDPPAEGEFDGRMPALHFRGCDALSNYLRNL